jgi:hypothetical protein
MHIVLSDGLSQVLEIYPESILYLKVNLRDRELPLALNFTYTEERLKDLMVYCS